MACYEWIIASLQNKNLFRIAYIMIIVKLPYKLYNIELDYGKAMATNFFKREMIN